MTDLNEIQFEERNVSSAITWGIITVIYFVIISFFLGTTSALLASPGEIFQEGLITIHVLLYISTWAVRFTVAVWVVKIARELNRQPFIWGFFGFVSPPLTLIVLGFQDYRIADKNIKKIIDELRLDYNTEFLHIKSTKDLSEEELNEVEIKLKEKFNQKLRDRIADSKFIQRIESGNISEEEFIKEQNEMEVEEEEVVLSVSNQNWSSDISKCPACGAPVGEKAVICQECGLTLD